MPPLPYPQIPGNPVFVAGETASVNFPTTANAFDTTPNAPSTGVMDSFVTRLNTTGTALQYSTYLGGTSGDMVAAISLDPSGNVYVVGRTSSGNGSSADNFPIAGDGVFQKAFGGGIDGFVSKFGDHTICGRIRTPAGAPLAGVTVTLSGAMSATVQKDSQGFYAFTDTVSSGSLTVTPSMSGFTFTPASRGALNLSNNKVFNFTGD